MNSNQRESLTKELNLVRAYKELDMTNGWTDMRKYLQLKYDKCIREAVDLRVKDENKLRSLVMAGVYKEILDRPISILKREESLTKQLQA